MDIFLKLGQEFPGNLNGIKIIEVTGTPGIVVGAKIERDRKNSFIVQ
jgi:Na+-translocating ferredoxin:NAD+ oxidoreductase RnfG subunit